MEKKHCVIIVPGRDGNVLIRKLLTLHWKRYGIQSVIHRINWKDKGRFEPKLKKLLKCIDQEGKKGKIISLWGDSAGGSAVLNAFVQRKNTIQRVAVICSRLRLDRNNVSYQYGSRAMNNSVFAESKILFKTNENKLKKADRKRILIVRAKFGDELVSQKSSFLKGANTMEIPTIEHAFSIAAAYTLFSKQILKFLKNK